MSLGRLRDVSPVIVGGVGGSGTRVVATILMKAGVFMGLPRNVSEDNLWFQFLLKRPGWQAAHHDREKIVRGLRLVRDMNLGRLLQGPSGYGFILAALAERQRTRQKHLPPSAFDQKAVDRSEEQVSVQEQGASPVVRKIRNFSRALNEPEKHYEWKGWGWKEPASFLYLPYFRDAFGEFKYVHVIRNGLDMAFSQNQSQLLNYGERFGSNPGTTSGSLRRASLKYWVTANDWVLEQMQNGETAGSCFTVKLEDLVADPQSVISRLLEFLNVSGEPEKLAKLVYTPGSIGRYRKHDLSIFDSNDISALERFGYTAPDEQLILRGGAPGGGF